MRANIGTRIYFNTDKGRIVANFMEVDGPSSKWETESIDWQTNSDLYISALATRMVGGTFVTPLDNEVRCNIAGTDNSYLISYKSTEPPYIILSDGVNSINAALGYSSTNSKALGLLIFRFTDNVWVPELHFIAMDSWIIPATSSAFGGINFGISGNTWQAQSAATIATWSALGESLKSAVIGEDAYDGIPASTSGGNTGSFVLSDTDDIDFPSLSTLSAVSTGFISLWSPNVDQMLRLSSFMWNADVLTTDFWKKLIANPMELIYGLSLVPLNLSDLGYIDGEGTVVVGLINTGITMNHLSSQWVLFDCGTVMLDETWGAYLDYDPYTKLEIYLPFCGVHPLKVDDFMPGSISLKYYIDLLSGTCVAVVKSTKSNKHGDVLNSVVYQFMGNCAAQIPVTAQQFADAVRAAINIAASIGSMVATGVGGAAAAAGAKNALGGISTTARTVSQEISTGSSAVENVMNIKPAIERSGAIGSAGSLLSVRTPYLILTRPRMARPDSQNVYTGYPSFITETLGDLKGWTIVQAIHLNNIPCTADEMNEIDELLKGGVIF